MATISDILKQEDDNRGVIHLYREGIFLVAYQKSAYLFTSRIKEYGVRKRH